MEAELKYCVIKDCNRKAIDECFKCKIPVCEFHRKRHVLITQQISLCLNCYNQIREAG